MGIYGFNHQMQRDSELYSEVLSATKDLLKNSPLAAEAREYLNKRVSPYNQEKYDFGYFPPNEYLDLLFSKVSRNTLKKLNLVYEWNVQDRAQFVSTWKGHFNSHNVILPYKDEYGNIVALCGRTLLPEIVQKEQQIHKYKYSKDFLKTCYLFGLYQAKRSILRSKSVIVVEGQIDCISCHAHGFHNAVALGGLSLTNYQLYLMMKSADTIYLLLDNDAPAKKAETKIIGKYSNYIKIQKIVVPDPYKDVDEYLHKSNNYSILDSIGV